MSASRSFGTPQKRSVTIAGHETSISLEPMFWAALEQAAGDAGVPVNALIADIDSARLEGRPIPNLTSAIRQWLFNRATRERALGGAQSHDRLV